MKQGGYRPEGTWSKGHSTPLHKFVVSKVLFLGLKTQERQQRQGEFIHKRQLKNSPEKTRSEQRRCLSSFVREIGSGPQSFSPLRIPLPPK